MPDGALGADLVGKKWEIEIVFHEKHCVKVEAGVERQDAIREAEEVALHCDRKTLADRMQVHAETEVVGEIFADDVAAGRVADWIDEPSAPSEETYWDDSRHFEDGDSDA